MFWDVQSSKVKTTQGTVRSIVFLTFQYFLTFSLVFRLPTLGAVCYAPFLVEFFSVCLDIFSGIRHLLYYTRFFLLGFQGVNSIRSTSIGKVTFLAIVCVYTW